MQMVWSALASPNISDLRPWSGDLAASMPFKPPYYAHYQRGPKELFYVAARHVYKDDPSTWPPHSLTFKTIEAIFDNPETRPEIVVIEGIENTRQKSPAFFAEKAADDALNNFRDSSESAFSAHQALIRDIPFVSGEPTDKEKLKHLIDRGYSSDDVVFSFVASYLVQEAERDRYPNSDMVNSEADRLLRGVARRYGVPAQPRDKLSQWFEDKYAQPLNLSSLTTIKANPYGGADAGFLQRFSCAEEDVREPAIVQETFNALQEYNRVLVVFGSAHEPKQALVFQRMFGQKPSYSKAF